MRWALASLKLRYPASANAYQLRSPVITSKLGADTIPGHTTWSKKSAFKFKEVSPSMQPELCRRYLHLRGPGLSLKCYIVERENKICIARPMADALRSRNSDTARRGSWFAWSVHWVTRVSSKEQHNRRQYHDYTDSSVPTCRYSTSKLTNKVFRLCLESQLLT